VLHLYKLVLLLYPSAHRQEFAAEMLSVFRQLHLDCASLGFKARVRFSLREIAGLLAGAFREQLKVVKGTLRGGAMRTFRFPRWTIPVMVLALLGLLAANAKITGMWAFLPLLAAAAMFVCVLGVVVFVLRAALGRTCIQRWTVAKTWPAQDARNR
jgi:hypothetical protein